MRHSLNSCLLLLILSAFSCQSKETHADHYACPMTCEGEKVYDGPGTCPVCKMDLVKVSEMGAPELDESGLSDASIFNLESKWVTQDKDTVRLKELKGKPIVVVMIYTSCEAACPRLVADMRSISQKVASEEVTYLLVSIDPEKDSPERLKEYAKEQGLEGTQWILLQGQLDDVREFSNVLSVKYKRISPIDFAHTNIISVFDQDGVLQLQQEGLGVDNSALVREVKRLLE